MWISIQYIPFKPMGRLFNQLMSTNDYNINLTYHQYWVFLSIGLSANFASLVRLCLAVSHLLRLCMFEFSLEMLTEIYVKSDRSQFVPKNIIHIFGGMYMKVSWKDLIEQNGRRMWFDGRPTIPGLRPSGSEIPSRRDLQIPHFPI